MKEFITVFGRCARQSVIIDGEGVRHLVKVHSNVFFDQDGSPAANGKIVGTEVYNDKTSREIDVCCNLFDAEDARRAIEKYIDLVYPGGRIAGEEGFSVDIFRAVSPGAFYAVRMHIYTKLDVMCRFTYAFPDSSFERSCCHISHDTERDWMSEALRGTFENLGCIKSQPGNGSAVDFTNPYSRFLGLGEILRGDEKARGFLADLKDISGFRSFVFENDVMENMFNILCDCLMYFAECIWFCTI